MITNREHYQNTPLCEVESAYMDSFNKGYNKGFAAWLDFGYYKPETRMCGGKLMLEGRVYKGRLYTKDEFAEYARLGMLP